MKYKLVEGVFFHEEERKEYVINTNNNSVFEINEVASLIFKSLEQEIDFNKIFQADYNAFLKSEEKDII